MHSKAEKLKEALDMPQVLAHLLRPLLYWPAAVAPTALFTLSFAFSVSLDSAALPLVQALRCWYARQSPEHLSLAFLQAARREEGDASLYNTNIVLNYCELYREPVILLLLLHLEQLLL
jgi:hypothetical protein